MNKSRSGDQTSQKVKKNIGQNISLKLFFRQDQEQSSEKIKARYLKHLLTSQFESVYLQLAQLHRLSLQRPLGSNETI